VPRKLISDEKNILTKQNFLISPIFFEKHETRQFMQQINQYTTLFAPVLFFFAGIALVILLNKFIGKKNSGKETK